MFDFEIGKQIRLMCCAYAISVRRLKHQYFWWFPAVSTNTTTLSIITIYRHCGLYNKWPIQSNYQSGAFLFKFWAKRKTHRLFTVTLCDFSNIYCSDDNSLTTIRPGISLWSTSEVVSGRKLSRPSFINNKATLEKREYLRYNGFY